MLDLSTTSFLLDPASGHKRFIKGISASFAEFPDPQNSNKNPPGRAQTICCPSQLEMSIFQLFPFRSLTSIISPSHLIVPQSGLPALRQMIPPSLCPLLHPRCHTPKTDTPPVKGYEGRGLVAEVYHGVVGDQGVHKADHVMPAQPLLLRRGFVGDDVQALVHLREGEKETGRLSHSLRALFYR